MDSTQGGGVAWAHRRMHISSRGKKTQRGHIPGILNLHVHGKISVRTEVKEPEGLSGPGAYRFRRSGIEAREERGAKVQSGRRPSHIGKCMGKRSKKETELTA